jgi:hypothetical protein
MILRSTLEVTIMDYERDGSDMAMGRREFRMMHAFD